MVLPNAATRREIEEWVGLEIGYGSMACGNPLGHHSLEVTAAPVLEDLGLKTDLLDLREEASALLAGSRHPVASDGEGSVATGEAIPTELNNNSPPQHLDATTPSLDAEGGGE
jgi:hypothetical protein